VLHHIFHLQAQVNNSQLEREVRLLEKEFDEVENSLSSPMTRPKVDHAIALGKFVLQEKFTYNEVKFHLKRAILEA